MQWMICLACATHDLALCIMPTPPGMAAWGMSSVVAVRTGESCHERRGGGKRHGASARRRSCRCLPHNATWTHGAIAQLLQTISEEEATTRWTIADIRCTSGQPHRRTTSRRPGRLPEARRSTALPAQRKRAMQRGQ